MGLFAFIKVICLGTILSQNVLIIGDSEACAMKFGAIKAIQQPGENVTIDCRGGTRVKQWEGSWTKQALERNKFDAVIVFLGTNDYGMKPDGSKVAQQITDSGAKCVWVGPPLVRGKTSVTNGFLKTHVGNCSYLDSQALGVPLADGVHPTGAGAVKWLKAAWNIKDSLLKPSQTP